ncbi:MAG: hypothetical protein P8Y66_03855 [Nitrospirota bacterium]|jgi:hypothetical protein
MEREDKILEEKLRLLEREIATVADGLERTEDTIASLEEEVKNDMRALKLFLSRHFPEFKKEFLEIVQKLEEEK